MGRVMLAATLWGRVCMGAGVGLEKAGKLLTRPAASERDVLQV